SAPPWRAANWSDRSRSGGARRAGTRPRRRRGGSGDDPVPASRGVPGRQASRPPPVTSTSAGSSVLAQNAGLALRAALVDLVPGLVVGPGRVDRMRRAVGLADVRAFGTQPLVVALVLIRGLPRLRGVRGEVLAVGRDRVGVQALAAVEGVHVVVADGVLVVFTLGVHAIDCGGSYCSPHPVGSAQ